MALYDGTVVNVHRVAYGTFLTAAAASGATVLSVEDAGYLNEDGGTLLLDGAEHAYTAVDMDEDVVTLAAPLPTGHDDLAEVLVYPLVYELVADTVVEDDEEPMSCRVPHALYDKLPEGLREPWKQESVLVGEEAGELVVRDVLGSEPLVDLTFADPDTLPEGAEGPQGIPGPPGQDGQSLYTWLKYADTPTTGMADTPTGKTYMGLAYNQTTPTESEVYGDYQWSLIRGEAGEQGDQGVPGPPGEDGQPTYTWIKYGTSATGAGIDDDPTGKTYIGIAYNQTTPTESTDPGQYQWALIQGPQGQQGPEGEQGDPGPPGLVWRGTWEPENAYAVNDAVVHEGATYRRVLAGTTATGPDDDPANWELLADRGEPGVPGLTWVGAWDAATAYAVNDAVTYNGSSYRRIVAGTTAATPDADADNWEGVAVIDYLLAGAIDNDSGTFALGRGTVRKIETTGPLGELVGMAAIDPDHPEAPNGFYSFGPPEVAGSSGPPRMLFPVDGSKPNIVSGESEFDTLKVNEQTTFDGPVAVSPGERVTLQGSIQAPKNKPLVSADWHTVQHTGSPFSVNPGWRAAGLTLGHDGNWYTVASRPGSSPKVERFHPTTGALVSTTNVSNPDYQPYGGIVYASHHGGRYYLLVQRVSDGNWFIEARDTSFALVNPDRWQTGLNNTARQPTIGWAASLSDTLLLGYVDPATGGVRIWPRTMNSSGHPTTASPAEWVSPAGFTYDFDLGFVARVNTESGDRYVFRRTHGGQAGGPQYFQVFTTAATPVNQTSEEWPANGSVAGGWYDGARFWSLTNNGDRVRYETGRCMWTSGSAVREVQTTLYRTGSHQTTPSPKASVTLPKRARLSVTFQAIPTGDGGAAFPNAARIYVGVGSGVANGAMNLEKTVSAPGTSWSLDSAVAQESATTHPPTANGFPAANPSGVDATTGGFTVDSSSNGSVGTGTFRDSVRSAVGGRFVVGGEVNSTVGASGVATFNHGLGTTPAAILVTHREPGNVYVHRVTAKSASSFDVQFRNATGTIIGSGTAVTINFAAFV